MMNTSTTIELATHVIFDGNCQEALDFYATLLGGQIIDIERDPERENHVIQSTFVAPGFTFFALDNRSGLREGRMRRALLSLTFSDVAESHRVFEALAKQGEVESSYSDEFGGVVYDRFGIRWKVKAV